MATDPSPRVFLRPIGSPLPLGLAGLAVASLMTTGLDLGWIDLTQSTRVGLLLLVSVVPIQLLASAVAFASRDGATASAIGVLAATWAAYGLTKATSAPGTTSGALGLLLVMAAGVLAGAALSKGLGSLAPGLVMALAGARFAAAGIYELTASSGWQDVAGAVGIAVAAAALALVWARELHDARAVGLDEEPGVRPRL
jgi:hypothetical protein